MTLAATFGFFASPNLRRVRREEVAKPANIVKPDPYALCLACWVDYMRTDDRDLSAGGMKLESDAVNERDVHAQQRSADIETGKAVNAMIDSLTVQHRWAISKSQGIATAWRFPNADYATVLTDARDELEKKLRNNVATRLYWA